MEKLATLFEGRAKAERPRSERAELIEYFSTRANADRDGKRFKKLSVRFYAVKLSHLQLRDLHYLRSVCEDATRRGGSWAKTFWGSLKVKPDAN